MTEKKILLVEDSPDDIDLTLRALKKNDIKNEVIIARDGEEALNRLTNSYVRKPVDFHQFSAAVQQLGLYWLFINETPPETMIPHAEEGESTDC